MLGFTLGFTLGFHNFGFFSCRGKKWEDSFSSGGEYFDY
jgi:hypothetical protein